MIREIVPLPAAAATEQGLALHTLAAFMFGNNAKQKSLGHDDTRYDDTRFYLSADTDHAAPPPLSEDAAAATVATPWLEKEYRKIRLERIPPARWARASVGWVCHGGGSCATKSATSHGTAIG